MPIQLPQLFAGLIFAVWIVVGLDAFVETWLAAMRQPPSRALPAVAAPAAGRPVAALRQEPLPAPAAVPTVATSAPDAGRGLTLAKKCSGCHSFGPGEANRAGPNLHGVSGRERAGAPGFAYSPALQAMGGSWTPEALDAFLAKPADAVPGTKMAFAGVADPADRADLIAYLHSLSSGVAAVAAAPAGAQEEVAIAAPAPAGPRPQDFALRLNKADAERGKAAAGSCNRCHGTGKAAAPPLDGVVGRDIGSVPGYRYSVTLQTLEGPWLYEWLDQFLAEPDAFAPGSQHDFAGLADAGERADLIAFLRSISPQAPALPLPTLAPQTDAPQ